jgi:hypothetical protein
VPIVIRPIREQFEHDRVVRHLQTRFKRRYTVAINPGNTEETAITLGARLVYPDVLLTRTADGRRRHDVIEVETAESINHLEALSQWAHLATVRGAFSLYVPAGHADLARRLCEEQKIRYSEIWTYNVIGGQVGLAMAFRSAAAARAVRNANVAKRAKSAKPKVKAKSAKKTAPARKTAKKPAPAKKTSKRAAPAKKTAKAVKKKVARTAKPARKFTVASRTTGAKKKPRR